MTAVPAKGLSAETFNRRYKIGAPVTAFTCGRIHALRTRTSSIARSEGIGNAVVSVEGRAGWLPLSEIFINPSEDFTEGNERLVTKETVTDIASWLEGCNVPSSPYIRTSLDGSGAEIHGWRVGAKPDRVVAMWGDTLVRLPDGTFTVRRIIAPRLGFFPVDNETDLEDLAEEDPVCECKNPSDRFVASLSEGRIELRHKDCGLPPSFTHGDWRDLVEMNDIEVSLKWVSSGVHNPFVEGCGCDCDHYIELTPTGKGEGSGHDQ
jgi:hypothetical protein